MSDLKTRFDAATADAKMLRETVGNDVKLRMYGLYKQGEAGDVTGSRPGFMDIVGRAKYDAWAAVKGLGAADAMRQFVDLVESLKRGRAIPTNEPVEIPRQAEAPRAEPVPAVSAQRRAFLETALMSHLGPEAAGDLPGITASYAAGGHLNFNGALYDTPKALESFHRNFGFDGRGMISNLSADMVHVHYTFGAVIVEYAMRGTVAASLAGAPAGRPVTLSACAVYCFDEAGKLTSERVYLDSGRLLPEPFFRP